MAPDSIADLRVKMIVDRQLTLASIAGAFSAD
jgi:hypothetical protein